VAPYALVATVIVGLLSLLFLMQGSGGDNTTEGTVDGLFYYPIKSCAETKAASAMACPRGFAGDRMFQVTDSEGRFCTPREVDKKKLFHVKPSLSKDYTTLKLEMEGQPDLVVDMKKAKKTDVVVEVLVAKEKQAMFDFGDAPAAWLAKATDIEGCRLSGFIGAKQYVRQVQFNPKQEDKIPVPGAGVSLADEAPYLVTSTSSLADLNERLQKRGAKPVDMRRFRPNIVISGFKPWEEDIIKKCRIGQEGRWVEFWAWQRCGRCAMTTIDRDTLERCAEPLKTLGTFRKRQHATMNFGMHLIPVKGLPEGGIELKKGDRFEITEIDTKRRKEWRKLFG